MPIKDCITDGNKLYCWNDETREVDVYTRTSMPVERCPKNIVVQLMHLLNEKKENEVRV